MPLLSCGETSPPADPTNADAALTGDPTDTTLREALEAPLASDPHLTADSNRDAIRPSDKPLTGAVPTHMDNRDGRAEALKMAGGKFISTPPVSKTITSIGGPPITLVGLAETLIQKQGLTKAGCDLRHVQYDMAWAQEMPRAIPIYPAASLVEAAGSGDNARDDNAKDASNRDTPTPCAIRAVRFRTTSPISDTMDFYTSMAKRGGYPVEHITENGTPILTGGKASSHYIIRFHDIRGQGTDVEMVTISPRP